MASVLNLLLNLRSSSSSNRGFVAVDFDSKKETVKKKNRRRNLQELPRGEFFVRGEGRG